MGPSRHFGIRIDRLQERVLLAPGPQYSAANVFPHAHLREDVRDLERAGQSAAVDLVCRQARNSFTVETHLARTWDEQSADEVEERGFACAVRPNHRMPFVLGNDEVDAANDFCGTEVFLEALQFQRRVPGQGMGWCAWRCGECCAHTAKP